MLAAVKQTGLDARRGRDELLRASCHAMRTIYRAGGFGRLVYSEGEYSTIRSPPSTPTGTGAWGVRRSGIPPTRPRLRWA